MLKKLTWIRLSKFQNRNLNLKVRELRSNYAKDEINIMPTETLHALHECPFKALFGHDAFLQWFCTS